MATDETTDSDEPTPDADESETLQITPPECDLFQVPATKVADLLARGADPRIAYVRIRKSEGGTWRPIEGTWPVEQTSRAWILEHWGPGIYDVSGCNEELAFVTRSKIQIHPPATRNGHGASSYGNPNGNGGGSDWRDDLVKTLLLQALNKKEEPIGSTIKPVIEMMAASVQLQQQMVSTQLQLMAARDAPAQAAGSLTETLLKEVIKNKNPSGGQPADVMQAIRFGLEMGKIGAPAAPGTTQADADAKHRQAFIEALVGVSDTLGPGLVATLAQASLPADKAAAVLDLMAQHFKAREAEAANEPIDTEGEAAR